MKYEYTNLNYRYILLFLTGLLTFCFFETKAQCTKSVSTAGEVNWTSLGGCANSSPYTGNVTLSNALTLTSVDIVLDINMTIVGSLIYNISLGGVTRLIVPDGITLVVQGDLTMPNNAYLIVSPRASVIVTGTVSLSSFSQLGGGGVITGANLLSGIVGSCFSSVCGTMAFGVCTGNLCSNNNVNSVICSASPITTITPANSQGCSPYDPGTLTVTSTPSGYVLARWEKSTDNGSTWTSVSGTSPGSTYAPGSLLGNTLYRTVYTSTSGSNACLAYSNSASVQITGSILPAPTINTQPSSQSVCLGNSVTFTVSASGANLSYQWKKGGTNISGATSASYTILSTSAGDAANYTVTVTSSCGSSTTSSAATLTIPSTIIPSVSISVSNSSICIGSSVTFTASGSNMGGGTATYTFKNGASVVQTGSSKTYTVSPSSNLTITCDMSVSGASCVSPSTVSSSSASVSVNTVVQPVITGASSICLGGALNLTATSSTSGAVYVWSPPSTASGISGLTTNNITKSVLVSADAGTYKVYAVVGSCQSTLASVTLSVEQIPDVTQPSNQTLCNGATTTSVSFSGSVSGTVFNWTNTASSIGIAASGTGAIGAFSATNTGTTTVIATITVTPMKGSCAGSTKSYTYQVEPTPDVTQPSNQTLCTGTMTTAVSLSGTVSGTTFNWTNNTTSIGLAASGSGNIAAFSATNTGTATVIATVSITPTRATCTGTTKTFTYQVEPIPDVTQPSNQIVCNGISTAAVTFTGSVSGTTFNWTNNTTSIGLAASGSGNIAAFSATNTGTSAVTATVTVTPTRAGCGGSAKTFSFQVNPTPDVAQPSNQTLCNGVTTAAVSFSGTLPSTTFNWTNNTTSIGLAASGSGNIASFSAANTGTATITATVVVTPSLSGCNGSTKTFSFQVEPTPDVTQPSNQTVCNGISTAAVTFTGSVSGTTFNWTNNTTSIGLAASGSGNIAAFSATNIGTSAVTATVTVTPTRAGCGGSAKTFSFQINPTPDVTQPSNQTICNGASTAAVAFTGSVSGTTFNWTNNTTSIGLAASGSGNIAAFSAINTGTSSVTATVTVTPTRATCTGTNKTFTYQVDPTPDVAQPSNQTLCNGVSTAAVTFTGSVSGTTFNWTNNTTSIGLAASGSGNIAAFSAINTGTSSVTATVTVTPTRAGCGGSAKTFSFQINPTPDVTQPSNQTICNGASTAAVTFTGSVSGTTFNWTNNTTSIGLAASGSGNIAAFSAVNTGIAAVTATVTVTPTRAGCGGSAKTFSYQVNPTPDVAQPSNQTLCNGVSTAAVTFTGSVSGTTFNWTNNTTSIGLAASGSGNIAAFSAVNTGIAAVTATVTVTPTKAGCGGSAKTFTYQVDPTPDVTQPSNQTVCNGVSTAAVTFTGSVSGTTFNWANNTTSINLAASGSGNIAAFSAINTGTSSVTATVTVTPTRATCTGTNKTFTYQVNPTPDVTQPSNQTVCNGVSTAAVSFTGSVSGTTFNWANNTTSIGLAASGSGNIAAFSATNTSIATVTATVQVTPSANTCTGTQKTFTYTVYAPPSIVTQPSNLSKCVGENATFIVTAGGTNPTYQWKKNGVDLSGVVFASFGIPSISASDAATYTVLVSGTCPSPVLSNGATLTISSDNTWNGSVSQDWFTPSNWSCGSLPSKVLHAIIPSASQYPIVSTIATAFSRDISIASTASLTLSENASLSVYGNWSNAGTFSTNNATVEFKGTSNQTISNTSNSATEHFYRLTIGKNAGTVALASPVSILANGSVKIDSGTLDLQNKSFILRSSAPYVKGSQWIDSTARLSKIAGTLLNTSNFGIERYIPTPPISGAHLVKNRFLCTPLSSVTAKQWADSVTILGGDPSTGFIQRSGWTSPLSTLLWYNEQSANGDINARFKSILTKSTSLNVGQGYALSVGYDAQSTQTLYASPRNYVVVKTQGSPTVGDFSTSITKSGADPDGWNLVGNPYPCEIDWDQVWNLNTSHISSTMVILDPLGGITSGQHFYYNARTGKSIDPRYSIDSIHFATTSRLNPSHISSCQAFFIFAKTTGTSPLLFKESIKPSSDFRTVSNFRDEELPTLQIGLSTNTQQDNAYLFFDPASTWDGFDADLDCYKLSNAGLNISTNTFGQEMAMNGIPLKEEPWEIPINIRSNVKGPHQLWVNGTTSLPLSGELLLKDRFTSSFLKLAQEGQSYPFEITQDPTTQGQRFSLLYAPSLITNWQEFERFGKASLYPNPALPTDVITVSLEHPLSSFYSFEIIDATGTPLYQTGGIPLQTDNTLYLGGFKNILAQGVYTVRITSDTQVFIEKLVYKR